LFASQSFAQNDPENGQSTFVSADKSIMFGFTVPSDAADDVDVTIRVPVGLEWGAIGIGSDVMAGSFIMMIYMNTAGDNVTFSPRVAYDNYEPVYYPNPEYQVLSGTGIYNDTMVFSMRCTKGCRNWPGGYVDTTSPNQKAIYAVGPVGTFASDDPAAGVRYHGEYGTFNIDMKRTQGADDAPFLDAHSVSEGTTPGSSWVNKSDYKASLHAVVMIFCFVGLMPLGVLILRIGEWVSWHGLNQGISLLGVLIGATLGILAGLLYQRVRRSTLIS
jgi:Cytochrome domain of cellobiose dehydrogenase